MHFKRTIAGRMLACFLVVNSLLLIALGFVLVSLSDDVLREELSGNTERVLVQTNRILDTYLIDMRSTLVHLASSQSVINCMSAENFSYSDTLHDEREINKLFGSGSLFSPITDILLVGRNGYVYNLTHRQDLLSDYDYTETEWFKQAIDVRDGRYIQLLPLHDQTYYTPMKRANQCRELTLSLSIAVTNYAFETIGAVVCNLNLPMLSRLFAEGNYEKDGRIALLDDHRTICIQSDGRQIGEPFPISEADAARMNESQSGHFIADLDGQDTLICYDSAQFSNWKLVSYVPLSSVRAHAQPLHLSLLSTILIGLILNIVLCIVYSRSIQKPVSALLQSLSQVDADNLSPIPVRREYTELEDISEHFNVLLNQINQLISKNYRIELERSRFELAALQSQINPHFLFNTLQLLQTEILYENVEKSNRIIITLSQLLRYCMTTGESVVTLSREIEYLEKYLMLFMTKYEGRLTAQIVVQPGAETVCIPKLLLQPIVENSIRHVADARMEACTIYIDAHIEDDVLIVTLRDDGSGIDAERLEAIRSGLNCRVDWMKSSVGLANVHQRIRTIYGTDYGLSIDSSPAGTVVIVRLPANLTSEGELIP